MGRDAADTAVRLTASLALDLFQMADRRGSDPRSHVEIMTGLLEDVPSIEVVVPRHPGSLTRS